MGLAQQEKKKSTSSKKSTSISEKKILKSSAQSIVNSTKVNKCYCPCMEEYLKK
jgi:hypothetical protein